MAQLQLGLPPFLVLTTTGLQFAPDRPAARWVEHLALSDIHTHEPQAMEHVLDPLLQQPYIAREPAINQGHPHIGDVRLPTNRLESSKRQSTCLRN
jgi:hypothetical protein